MADTQSYYQSNWSGENIDLYIERASKLPVPSSTVSGQFLTISEDGNGYSITPLPSPGDEGSYLTYLNGHHLTSNAFTLYATSIPLRSIENSNNTYVSDFLDNILKSVNTSSGQEATYLDGTTLQHMVFSYNGANTNDVVLTKATVFNHIQDTDRLHFTEKAQGETSVSLTKYQVYQHINNADTSNKHLSPTQISNLDSWKVLNVAKTTDDSTKRGQIASGNEYLVDGGTVFSVTNSLSNQIANLSYVVIGTTTPSATDQGKLWVDTTDSTGGLKYYNGSSWVAVPVQYT